MELFLSGIRQIAKDQSIRFSYWEPNLKGFEGEKLETLKTELRENLDRLVPGTCTSNMSVLECDAIKDILKKKWAHTARKIENDRWQRDQKPKEDETRKHSRTSLFEVLMEKQAKERGMSVQDNPTEALEDDMTTMTDSCRQLKEFIDGEQATASFSCGGTIHVDAHAANTPGQKQTSPPVNVFWSPNHDTSARKLVLPLSKPSHDDTPHILHELVASCDPASFGLGEKDVIDPAYRKAGKINPDQFATSFHPADFGILESIEQVLLPSISDELDNALRSRKIKAELYKLNVYSGPSGLFRRHVDTPRSENQIGSLVVCLPSEFEGGSLIVQHGGQMVEFDWSTQSSSTIQWAAFYSDCEHEIKTITHGDRITLTYNLFVTGSIVDEISSPTSAVDPKTLPLHSWMEKLLAKPDFMKEGGVLGIFCSHAYPHTSDLATIQVPRALKGADLVLYSVFKSLGIELAILPIIAQNGVYAKNPELGLTGTVDGSRGNRCSISYRRPRFYKDYLMHGKPFTLDTVDFEPADFYCDDLDQRWKWLLMTRKIAGMEAAIYYAKENNLPLKPNSFYEAGVTLVGKGLMPYDTSDYMIENEAQILNDCFPVYPIPGITWITEPKHEEMAFSHIAHGNEPSICTWYSSVAILAVIPPAEKRMKTD
ncbi:hypothetical protein P170DRAFT_441188 [Aspergillus steynii IBT 23096]|uniref:Fe2OG dioxygenase domain-containing protein n=1 Tax=Aspergillus steynii IBT 23096 TaxID=1392250 RepID=A0A2I2FSX7_9EURO|nr:uncharacterized protein P170DRAFT_441188 [Aspergillus steynii IBT 23096]PLB43732.1 hypothetical protein P170DRAFT_441188 [Aspergillus steynii IBT 23096]